MATNRARFILTSLLALPLLLAPTGACAQVQDTLQQKCIKALDQSGALLAKTQSKEVSGCVSSAGAGLLPGTIESCFNADSRGKVASKKSTQIRKELRSCLAADLPDVHVPALSGPYTPPASFAEFDPVLHEIYSEIVQPSSISMVTLLAQDLLDNPASVSSTDPAAAACQAAVVKAAQGCEAARRKSFNKCKKTLIKNGASNPSAIASGCTMTAGDPTTTFADTNGRIAKKCEEKITAAVATSCFGVNLATAFPGVCETAPGFDTCVVDRIDCRICQQLNASSGLGRDCDLMDDGSANESCRTAQPVCGDDILDLPSEQCEDGNTTDGDCCSSTCQLESTSSCDDPKVILDSPEHGIFSLAPSTAVTGHVTNITLNNADLKINGVTVALAPDKTFATTVSLSQAAIFNPIKATLTRENDGFIAQDRVVVIAGDSIEEGDESPDGIAMRFNDRGLNQVEPAVRDLVDIDLATLVPPGTLIINDFCYAELFGACIGRVDVSISGSVPPSIGDFSIDMASMTNVVAGDITLEDLEIQAQVDDATGVPLSCTIDIHSDFATIAGDYSLEPMASDPGAVDVAQSGPVAVLLGGFSDTTSCGGLLGGLVEVLIDLFIGDIEDLVKPALEDFLNATDVNGNTPTAGAIETALSGIDIAGPIGGGLGVELDAPFTAITEFGPPATPANPGITFQSNAAAITLAPDPDAPNLTASYHVDETFPTFGQTTPVSGAPYGLGLAISTSAFNQLLRAQIESGLLRVDVDEIDVGFGPIPLTAGLLTAFIPEFATLPAATPLTVRLAPTLAPIVTGLPGPLGELSELRIAQLAANIVQVGAGPGGADIVWGGIVADALLGLDMTFDSIESELELQLTGPDPGDVTVALLTNPLGADEADIAAFVPTVLGLLLPQLEGALGGFPLPEFFGLTLNGVEVSRNGQYMSLFVDLL